MGLLHEQRTVSIVLLSTHAAQIVHPFFIFSNHQTECGVAAIVPQLAWQSSFKTAATQVLFSLFPALHSALHLQSTPHSPQTD